MQKRSSKFVIVTGFSFVLLLLLILVIIALHSVSSNNDKLYKIVDDQQKIRHIFTMREAAINRSLLLYKMVRLNDPFEVDEDYMGLIEQATRFMSARDALLGALSEDKELAVWKETRPWITRGGRSQNNVIQLIMGDRIPEAENILISETIPVQDRVRKGLGEMLETNRTIVSGELEQARQDNQTAYVLILILGIMAVALGISITVYVTRHNSRTENAIVAQKELAEQVSKAKTRFLANMSHEIRTPLTAIIGFSESLFNTGQNEQDKTNAAQTIVRNSKHLLQLINDVLDISKIEAGQLEIEEIKTSPFEVLFEIESILAMQAKDKGLEFNIEYNFPLPKQIFTDPLRLKQILINLCGNAIKFTHKGGVNVVVSCIPTEHKMSFSVIDTGIGVNADDIDNLFKPFSQADSSTTRNYGGTGLGLDISRKLAHKLGGKLRCDSEQGKGSTFTLTIGTGSPECFEFIEKLEQVKFMHEENLTVDIQGQYGGHILLAEDSVDNQELVSIYVRNAGAKITIVENGEKAVEAGLSGDFDLILMDMQMPVMDGAEAIKMLREVGYNKPIVSFTANAMKEDRRKCFDAGADDYLVKPIDTEHFYAILSRYLPASDNQGADINTFADIQNAPEFVELVNKFLDELPVLVVNMQSAFKSEDWDTVMHTSHQLKGAAGSFGYQEITNISENINNHVRATDLQPVEELIDQLYEQTKIVLTNRGAK